MICIGLGRRNEVGEGKERRRGIYTTSGNRIPAGPSVWSNEFISFKAEAPRNGRAEQAILSGDYPVERCLAASRGKVYASPRRSGTVSVGPLIC